MAAITPFTVSVPDEKLAALKRKLEETIFPDELENSAWERGAPLNDVKRLAEYWRDGFNWRQIEQRINQIPQFTTSIQADGFDPLNVHFVHQVSPVPTAVPLLFVHGWPGNFLEVEKLLPILGAGDGQKTPAFHIVAPSLPSFGFSEGTKKKGFGLAQYAETFDKLMLKLGYTEYITQGGDWGTMITRVMGKFYPTHVKASHINMVRGLKPTWKSNPILALQHALSPYSERDIKGFARTAWFNQKGSGYNLEQSTMPQTIGYSLADSPVGLLSWIYEKLHDWTDEYPWTADEILTWVSIYWFSTAGPAASVRIYFEARYPSGVNGVHRDVTREYVPSVKLGLAYFPKELSVVPHTWGATMGPVVYQSENAHGGHFAATEHPEVIAGDLMKMMGKGGPAFGCVKGRDGYARPIKSLL